MQRTGIRQTPNGRMGELEARRTLTPDQLTIRLAEIRRDVLPHVRKTERLEDGYVFERNGTPEPRARVERLIALERECCGGLQFDLGQGPQAAGLRLNIRGIDPQAGTLEQLLAGIERGLRTPLRRIFLRRTLSSTGI